MSALHRDPLRRAAHVARQIMSGDEPQRAVTSIRLFYAARQVLVISSRLSESRDSPQESRPAPNDNNGLSPPLKTGSASPSKDQSQAMSEDHFTIEAPSGGVFWRKPSPNADPYVKIGESISSGQVICIIEIMKLMTEVRAEAGGTIVDVAVSDGSPVSEGDVLFILAPEERTNSENK